MNDHSNLKILQFCDNFYPQVDGVVKVVDNSTRVMCERCEAKVVVPKYRTSVFDDGTLPYEVWRKDSGSIDFNGVEVPLPRLTPSFTQRVKEYSADIYHIHSPFFLGKYALRQAKENHVPVIATFHSQFKKDILSLTHSKVLTDVLLKGIVNVFNQCTEVWAPSKSTASVLTSYGYQKEIFVMENGTEFTYPTNIAAIEERARKAFRLSPSHKNLLFVGQMRDVKNIPLILRTVKKLLQTDDEYRLYLVGEGYDRPSYEQFVADNGLEERVRFLGKITDRELLSGVYAACDLFFFPSTYDNAPIVVREACVMKKPVLLPVGAIAAEPFVDGVNGYLAAENEGAMAARIERAFGNREEMAKIGARASKEIPITYEVMVDRTLDRYAEVIRRFRAEN